MNQKQNIDLPKDKFKAPVSKIERQLISEEMKEILIKIDNILDKHNTDFRILISHAYSQIEINPNDLNTLVDVFGSNRVFNFSDRNEISIDKYNFSDPNHFDLVAGN